MIATLKGTMLAPGVSKNGRLYTPELIEKAVARMQARIADEDARPIVMRTHHDAGDDTTQIVGRLTSIAVDDTGAAKYEAVLNGTQAARDILEAAGDDEPSLRNVSIFGWWLGRPRTARVGGQAVETADDLEIDAVDFTAFPGVEGARIDSVTSAGGGKSRESAPGRTVITESVDAQLSFVDEAAKKKPYGDVKYADPGYQKDKQARYPIDTKDHAKAAWSYINQAKNAGLYNPTQLNAVKARIKGALKKFGVTVSTKESVHPAQLLGETRIGECYACDGDRAGFSISANNGPINVNISAWDGIDPAELEVIAAAAMQAACDALKALDPDMDADIDVPGAPNADSDHDMGEGNDDAMESALPSAGVTPKDMAAFLARKKATASEATQTPAPTEAGPTVKESAVTDQQKAAETAAVTASELTAALTEAFKPLGEAFTALADAVKASQTPAAETAATETPQDRDAAPAAAETAPTATATESTPKVDVASEAQKAVQDAIREHIPTILESYGLPRRKGLARENTDTAAPQTPEQLWEQRGQVWDSMIPGGTPAAPTAPATPAAD
ncbi:DUF6582 domain-containing protein [Amycolatopsis sp. CFH S0078]|uniref:DUF6582 domain-containing protein n=1 Tax=Amycolatopsis sp. CFH S0078 TaxID=1644108 RepID=UPI00106EEF92|nr:DUF6582 domain-containing protein [Amycolatopsis sp. CFH S0078]